MGAVYNYFLKKNLRILSSSKNIILQHPCYSYYSLWLCSSREMIIKSKFRRISLVVFLLSVLSLVIHILLANYSTADLVQNTPILTIFNWRSEGQSCGVGRSWLGLHWWAFCAKCYHWTSGGRCITTHLSDWRNDKYLTRTACTKHQWMPCV